MLIPTDDGSYINSDEILQAKDVYGKKAVTTVITTKSGNRHTLRSNMTTDDLSKMMAPIVPAQPGFYKIYFIEEHAGDHKPQYWTEEIIAWQIGCEGTPTPVTPHEDRLYPTNAGWAILLPNGKITDPTTQDCDSIDDWVATMRKEEADARAKKEAAQ